MLIVILDWQMLSSRAARANSQGQCLGSILTIQLAYFGCQSSCILLPEQIVQIAQAPAQTYSPEYVEPYANTDASSRN